MQIAGLPLPGPLRTTPSLAFVGREDELARLEAARVRRDRGPQVVTVAGAAGEGKSRLVREYSRRCADDGDLVLYGVCDPSAPVAYQPVSEALAHLVGNLADDELARLMGPTAGELLRLFPGLVGRVAGLVVQPPAGAETEQHRLRTSLAELLIAASQLSPLVLVLEDLHWADRSTVDLLHHLLRTLGDARIVLVLTLRDDRTEIGPELADLLARLARADGTHAIRLAGLDAAAVEEMVAGLGGTAPATDCQEVVTALLELTGGNAFLLGELWRHLVETGVLVATGSGWEATARIGDQTTPDRIQHVVAQRLARLTPTTRSLLEVAAAIGPEADLVLLRAVVDADEVEVVAALEEAVASETVVATDDVRPAYRFTHELVRRAVYDRLNGVARARVHLRVAQALERLPLNEHRRVRELATHWTAAAELGHVDRAVTACLHAAEVAARQLAFSEAADRLGAALILGVPDAGQGRVCLQRGDALRASGAWHDAIDSYRQAARWARDHADTAILVESALGLEETCWRPGIVDAGADALLDEAIVAVGPGDSLEKVRLLSSLARAHGYRGAAGRAATARRSAEDMARRLGDRRALAGALAQSYWGRGGDSADVVVEALAEAHDLAIEMADPELALYVRAWQAPPLLEAGRLDELRVILEADRSPAERVGQQIFLYHRTQAGAALALAEGRLADAERLADSALAFSRLGGLDASAAHGIQMFGIRREQGRLDELAPMARLLAGQSDTATMWRPGLAVLFAELGMAAEARRETARLLADDFADVPDDALRVATLTYLGDACWLTEDRSHAAPLFEALQPLAGTWLMVAGMVAVLGMADRYLGMLASCLGEWEVADHHFTVAALENERQGLVTALAWTWFGHGKMLLDRGRPPDRARADELVAAADRLATRHGLEGLRARVQGLQADLVPVVEIPDGMTAREVDVLLLVAEGRSNREIGEQLFISQNTAANHVRSILMKTGCANRTEATTYAHRQGLIGHTGTGPGRRKR